MSTRHHTKTPFAGEKYDAMVKQMREEHGKNKNEFFEVYDSLSHLWFILFPRDRYPSQVKSITHKVSYEWASMIMQGVGYLLDEGAAYTIWYWDKPGEEHSFKFVRQANDTQFTVISIPDVPYNVDIAGLRQSRWFDFSEDLMCLKRNMTVQIRFDKRGEAFVYCNNSAFPMDFLEDENPTHLAAKIIASRFFKILSYGMYIRTLEIRDSIKME